MPHIYGKRCRECAKLKHESAVCRSVRHKAVELGIYTEEGQIDTVDIDYSF